jgi:cobalamin biosynthesis protein CobD/CbiB
MEDVGGGSGIGILGVVGRGGGATFFAENLLRGALLRGAFFTGAFFAGAFLAGAFLAGALLIAFFAAFFAGAFFAAFFTAFFATFFAIKFSSSCTEFPKRVNSSYTQRLPGARE